MKSSNRRNYYRVLHVQPEAPVEVIRASYRTLMGPLGLHPDKGGDHEMAALINEAYAVLTDPARRRAYDLAMGDQRRRARGVKVAPNDAVGSLSRAGASRMKTGAGGRSASAGARTEANAGIVRPDPAVCALCTQPAPAMRRASLRCTRCDAPLMSPPRAADSQKEMFGRRVAPRTPKDHPVILQVGWPSKPLRATLRDLSLTGLRLLAPIAIPAGTVLRVTNADLDAIALVMSCRRTAHQCSIHAELLAADFARREGMFVAATA